MILAKILLGIAVLAARGVVFADSGAPHAGDVAAYDRILKNVAPDQTTVVLGDMIVPIETVRLWRDQQY